MKFLSHRSAANWLKGRGYICLGDSAYGEVWEHYRSKQRYHLRGDDENGWSIRR